jgi:RNA polymerase sigma factor (sigma-70 family)
VNTVPDGRNESLDELFGSVFGLAGEFAGQISRDEVEARLRRVLRQASHPASDVSEPSAATLVLRAAGGEQDAWGEIVERYAPLVYGICRRYRLSDRDLEDVGQQVWLRLVNQIGRLREPAALPGWLATTTARECLRVRARARRSKPLAGWQELADDAAADGTADGTADGAVDAEILAAERDAALRAALAELPPDCQRLLAMLLHDPPYSYREISAALGIPVGSIGPQRARCLLRLRQSVALSPYGDGSPQVGTGRPPPKAGPAA